MRLLNQLLHELLELNMLAEINTPLSGAESPAHITQSIAQALRIDCSASINTSLPGATDEGEKTLLGLAAFHGHPQIVF